MIGAWCARPTKAQITRAKQLGIERVHLMVNDHSADTRPTDFRCDDRARDYAAMITDAGLELHITSWIMPHVLFLTQACAQLTQLALDTGAHSIEWDAERPWTHATAGLPHADAAAMIQLYGCREGVSGIGYGDRGALQPLVARADYVTPQAYVTTTSGLTLPGVPQVLAHWESMACSAVVIPALAAYRQPRNGLVSAWKAAGRPSTVMLWALRHMGASSIAAQVRDLAEAMG